MSMTVNQIGRVGQTTSLGAPEQVQQSQRRIALHTADVLEQAKAGALDFSKFSLPLSAEQKTSVTSLFASIPQADRAALQTASVNLAAALMNAGGTTSSGGASTAVTSTVQDVMHILGKGGDDHAKVTQQFMASALGGMEAYLGGFAKSVESNNAYKQELRTTVAEIQDMVENWPEGVDKQEFTWTEVTYDENGNPTVTEHTEEMTKDEFMALRDKLEGQLETCGEMGDLMQFDLQKVYQDYQQAIQTLAAIQEQMHKDASAILNNLKG